MNKDPYLPLTEPTFYVLLAFREPCHGYKAKKKIEAMSNGEVFLAPGTLYGAIENLEKEGLITYVRREGPRKKIYEITEKGKEVLEKESHRLMHLITLYETFSKNKSQKNKKMEKKMIETPLKKKEEELFY